MRHVCNADEKKDNIIKVRVDSEMKAFIERRAHDTGISESEAIRTMIFLAMHFPKN